MCIYLVKGISEIISSCFLHKLGLLQVSAEGLWKLAGLIGCTWRGLSTHRSHHWLMLLGERCWILWSHSPGLGTVYWNMHDR